jgi:drug/metabolite transporter (DMT)-like permease
MWVPTALLLLGGIAYGSMFSANKTAVDAGLPISAYAFWQALFAAAIMLIGAAIGRDVPRLNLAALKLYAVVAVTGFVGPLVVFSSVAHKVPPGVLTLIVALIPTTTYALSLIMRMDRFRWLNMAGVALGFGGILLIVLPSGSLEDPDAAIWVVFALLVPLSAAINNVAGERLTPPKSSTFAMAGAMLTVAAAILFVIMLARDGFVLVTNGGSEGLVAVLWATAAQAVTYACFFEIVRRAGGLFFALLNYVVVAAGLFWASILFGNQLTLWVWLSVAVLAASLVLTNIGTARALRERAARNRG